jgi:aminoglycoside phosphotransferase (APT) family kinase protein
MDRRIARMAARYGAVRSLPAGVANHVFGLGDDHVLRVPRSAQFAADLEKEAEVIPVTRAAGVRTAELVSYSAAGGMVLTRIAGTDLAERERTPALLREVGGELAKLHRVTTRPPRVPEYDDDGGDPRRVVADLRGAGMIDGENAAWLDAVLARLAGLVPADPPRVLVHGDIAPQNLMAAGGRLTGILDWGDSAWADPAIDFAKMPLTEVPAMLAGYRAGGAGDGDWEARILRHHLSWALGRLADPAPRAGERHWTAPPLARLLGLLRFAAGGPGQPWASLLHGHSG